MERMKRKRRMENDPASFWPSCKHTHTLVQTKAQAVRSGAHADER